MVKGFVLSSSDVSAVRRLAGRVNGTPLSGRDLAPRHREENEGADTPIIYDGSPAAGQYTADYKNGDIHRITAPAGNLSVSVSNIPLGYSLLLRVDNTAHGTVTWGAYELIGSDENGRYVLTFANLLGVANLYARLQET